MGNVLAGQGRPGEGNCNDESNRRQGPVFETHKHSTGIVLFTPMPCSKSMFRPANAFPCRRLTQLLTSVQGPVTALDLCLWRHVGVMKTGASKSIPMTRGPYVFTGRWTRHMRLWCTLTMTFSVFFLILAHWYILPAKKNGACVIVSHLFPSQSQCLSGIFLFCPMEKLLLERWFYIPWTWWNMTALINVKWVLCWA